MPLSSLSDSEVIAPEHLNEYQRSLDFFFSELVDLNVNVYILREISQFPFNLYCGPDDTLFFSQVVRNTFDACLLSITRLLTDAGADAHTLTRFRNRLLALARPEFGTDIRTLLRETRFDAGTRALIGRVQEFRNHWVAHKLRTVADGSVRVDPIALAEVEAIRDSLNTFINAISFNTALRLLPVAYDPEVISPRHADSRSDIARILDSIAGESRLLNMPEDAPRRWIRRRATLSHTQLAQLNQYRRRRGLPDA
jgi:hypothetical protein